MKDLIALVFIILLVCFFFPEKVGEVAGKIEKGYYKEFQQPLE